MAEIVSVQPIRSEGACRFDVVLRSDKGRELRLNVSAEQLLDYDRFQHAVLDECGSHVHIVARGAGSEADVRAQWLAAVGQARWPTVPLNST